METKRLHVEIKNEEEGIVQARFATLGVKDHDGDVIEPGAFGKQRVKVSAYGHTSWQGALPVGIGTTSEKGDEAIADLEFFLNTTHGRDHFETVKGLGDLGEWSFGFDVNEEAAPDEEQRQAGVKRILKSLTVHEVSPVLRGAGVGTQTLGVKCDACAAKAAVEEEEEGAEPEITIYMDAPDEAGTGDAETEDPEAEPVEEEPDGDLRNTIMAEVGRYELLQANKPTGL